MTFLSRLALVLFFLVTISVGRAYCSDFKTVRVIDEDKTSETQLKEDDMKPVGQYYFIISVEKTNISIPKDDGFWAKFKSVFVDEEKEIVLTAQSKVSGHVRNASLIFSGKKSKDVLEEKYVKKERILSPMRLQPEDVVTLEFKFSEVDKRIASAVSKLLKDLSSLYVVEPIAKTVIEGVTSTVEDLITGSDIKKLDAIYNFESRKEIANTGYFAIVDPDDIDKLYEKANKADNNSPLPLSVFEKSNIPSYILIKVRMTDALFEPDQVLKEGGPIKNLVDPFIDSIRGMESNKEKCAQCFRMRTYLNSALNLNERDRTNVALAVMKTAGYRPDESIHHEKEGCFTRDDRDYAREHYGFVFPGCTSPSCNQVSDFVNYWMDANDEMLAQVTTPNFKVIDKFSSPTRRRSLTASEFLNDYALDDCNTRDWCYKSGRLVYTYNGFMACTFGGNKWPEQWGKISLSFESGEPQAKISRVTIGPKNLCE